MPNSRPIERKLTTVLSADAANYSGRMSRDEEGTVRALRKARDVIDTAIAKANGRIANTSGDGLIAEFPSVVSAVRCAIDIQITLNRHRDLLPFRLGVHLGDVIIEGDDLLGDGVNLAARLQEMADVGGILISQQVYDHVRGKLADVDLRPLGPATPKHFTNEVGLYAVVIDGVHHSDPLENVGPKARKSAPQETVVASPAPVIEPPDATDLRTQFKKDRVRFGGAIAGLAALDIVTGMPAALTNVPIIVLAVIIYRKWKTLQRSEQNGDVTVGRGDTSDR